MPAKLKRVFSSGLKDLKALERQIKDAEISKDENFDSNLFWEKIGNFCKACSSEITKLSLAFSNTTFPKADEATKLVQLSVNAVKGIAITYLTFSSLQGKVLVKEIESLVFRLLHAIMELFQSFEIRCHNSTNCVYLSLTGNVWDICKCLEKCSRNALEAASKIVYAESNLVSDALSEIQMVMSNDHSMEDSSKVTWSDFEKLLLKPCVDIIIVTQSVMNSIYKSLEIPTHLTTEEIKDVDNLVSNFKDLSPLVDDLVILMYPPLNVSDLNQMVETLCNKLIQVVNCANLRNIMEYETEMNSLLNCATEKRNSFLLVIQQQRLSNLTVSD